MRPVDSSSPGPRLLKTIGRVIVAVVVLLVLVIAFGAISAGTACAHDPRFACSPCDAAHPILASDPAKSWAFYGRLEQGQADHYSIHSRTNMRVPVSILLDVRDAGNPARPIASVYDGSGAIVDRIALSKATTFYEPFSRVSYITSGEREITLARGRSTVVIAMRGGTDPQRYVFTIGREERFGLLELPYVAGAIYRIHMRKF